MLDVVSLCDEIQIELARNCFCVRDINLTSNNNRRVSHQLPVVLVCDSCILVFMQVIPSERDSEKTVFQFRSVLNTLVEKLDISIGSFMICGCVSEPGEQPSEFCTFNIYNDRINYFSCENQSEDFLCSVIHELKFRRTMFELSEVSALTFNLQLMASGKNEIKKDMDGNHFIKKHGQWYLASDLDPDETFRKAAFFGAFGAHKFHDNKKTMGLIYFLSCGLFGVGWLLDCLAILAGIYKDSEGRYLLPVSNRKDCIIKLLIGFGIIVVYFLVYTLLLKFIYSSFSDLINNTISSQNIEPPSFLNE